MNEAVLTKIDANCDATVVLNRPEVHNALNPGLVTELVKALKGLEADATVRAIVIAAAGPSFCSGADINQMKKSATYTFDQNLADARLIAEMFYTVRMIQKPIVARIHGAVRGGGLGLVAAADVAVAARTASFRFSEVKLGIIPAMVSPFVIAAIGERTARRYMLTGEEFDAAEACRIGLVHDVVEEVNLDARVERLLAQLRSSAPHAIPEVKKLVADMAEAPLNEEVVAESARRMAEIRATPEAQEGLSAFLEKRRPQWATTA